MLREHCAGRRNRPAVARRTIGVLAAVLSITACAGGGDGVATDTVTLWGITSDQDEIVEPSLANWNAAHTTAPIKASYFEGEAYKTKIRTAIGAGSGPTLIYNKGGGTLRSYVEAGKVIDLSADFADAADRFLPFSLEPVTVNGAVYGIPMKAVAPVVLYYNKDVLAAAGVEPPKTWTDLIDAVAKLRARGVAPIALAGGSKWPELMWLEYLVDRLGGPDVFNAILAGKQGAWSDPAVIKATTMIQELVRAKGFVDGFSSVTTDSSADAAMLYTGKAAMLLQGTWVNNTFREQAADFAKTSLGYTTFPAVDGGAGDVANIVGNPTSYFAVSADASPEQRKAAVDYLKNGLWDAEFTDRLIEANQVPPLAGVDGLIKKLPDATFGQMVYDLISDAPAFTMSWDQALPPQQAQAMLTNLDRLFALSMTPEEFSTAMDGTPPS
jgi:raffinose/stachyose/melibiose transport system substrate-binding protein